MRNAAAITHSSFIVFCFTLWCMNIYLPWMHARPQEGKHLPASILQWLGQVCNDWEHRIARIAIISWKNWSVGNLIIFSYSVSFQRRHRIWSLQLFFSFLQAANGTNVDFSKLLPCKSIRVKRARLSEIRGYISSRDLLLSKSHWPEK